MPRRTHLSSMIVLGLIWGLFPGRASSEIITFHAELTGAWDPVFIAIPMGGTGSSAVGTLKLVYDTDTFTAIDIDLDVQGLTSAEFFISHVHPPHAGDFVFSLELLEVVDVPGGISITDGTALIGDPEWVPDLLNEQTWINVHTVAFPGGEIAGRLTRASPVPSFGVNGFTAAFGLMMLGVAMRMSLRGRMGRELHSDE